VRVANCTNYIVHTYRVGEKTGMYLRVDNFATVRGRKACDMSVKSFQILSKKYETMMSVKLNILCVVCINIQCIWNYAAFDNNA